MKNKTIHQSQFGTHHRFGTHRRFGTERCFAIDVILGQISPFYSMLVHSYRRMEFSVVLERNVVLGQNVVLGENVVLGHISTRG